MPTTTVRVTPETRAVIQELARESNQSMQTLIARAVEQYRRQLVLQHANDVYAALRAQPEVWAAEQEERRIWEGTLADDLEGNE
ncbi:MAG: ribbon-helix-helix protein, CopG family [Chloroflexi bacterium]|nr:ribbon-helix-helix protein, CopG family [Chloroflexota bacterium]